MKKMHPIAGLRRYGALFLSGIVSLSALSVGARPTLVVVPNSYTAAEGSSSATYPFSQSSMHYQQVFASSQFTNGGGPITQVSFRPDGSLAGTTPPFFPTEMTSVKITLGVTTNAPGHLSTTFGNNFQGAGTVVYGGASGAPLNLSTSYTGNSGGPNASDMRIYLTTSYTYDTNDGNLLMDVVFVNSNTTNPPTLDAVSVTSSPLTSRLWGTPSSATTGSTDSGTYKGLVTQFTFGNFALPATNHVGWLIFTANVTGIANISTSVAKHFFNNCGTLVAGNPGSNPIPSGGYTNATPLANYNSFAQFQSDLENSAILSVYDGNVVMYDNESWSKTPTDEKNSAGAYEALFANLAHANGYIYLTAPSPDLTGYPDTLPSPTRYDVFLASTNCFPAFSAAAPSEVFDNQAQKLEDDPTGYETWEWLTSAAADLATNANPACVIFAGITTTPDPAGTTPTPGQLEHAVTNTCSFYDPSSGYISGYWFNIPDNNYSLAEGALYLLMNNDGL